MTELKMADIYSSYLDEINALRKENKRLQEQLEEANHILKDVFISDAYYKSKQVQYIKRWGVK